MASPLTLRVTVDNAPAQELITRVREAAAEALAVARQDGQELTAEAAVDTALGAALAEILRIRSDYEDAEAELARLREGEETTDGHDPAVEHSNGQWLYRFNRATADERLHLIDALRANAARGTNCFLMDHEQRLAMQPARPTERDSGIDPGVVNEQQKRLSGVLGEVLAAFRAVTDDGTRTLVGYVSAPIHPNDMDRWRAALDPAVEKPTCARCKGRGYVPDWTNWDAYHGEPKPKPCPDCQSKES